MILEKINTLEDLLKERREAQNNVNKITAYSTRLEELQTIVAETEPLVKTCTVLRRNGIGDFVGIEMINDAVTYLSELKVKYYENPDHIIQAGATQQLKQSFSYYREILRNNLESSWKQYVETKNPVINEELLNVLSRINAFKSTVEKVRKLNSKIEEMKSTLPENQSDIDNFLSIIHSLNETWQKLGSDNVPGEVLEFLKAAVSPRGADLNLLTDEVRVWLKMNDVIHSFRIGAKN